MIDTILLDLDNTIYPASSGVALEIARLINIYTANYLGISEEEALAGRREHFARYGTTLQWLREEHGFNAIEDYFDRVHPVDMSAFLTPDPGIRTALVQLKARPCRLAIFTNAPREHALRVTDYYGITDLFDDFYDIRFHQLRGKPEPTSYTRVLQAMNAIPQQTLFVDDQPLYLEGFRTIGGHPLWVREAEPVVTAYHSGSNPDFPTIRNIKELPDWMEQC